MAAAQRAVTEAARARRLVLADAFLQRLKAVEACAVSSQLDASLVAERPVFPWAAAE